MEGDIEDQKKKLTENKNILNETRAQLHQATDEKEKEQLMRRRGSAWRRRRSSSVRRKNLYLKMLHDLNEEKNLYLRKEERLEQQQQATGEPHADVVLLYFICWFVATGPVPLTIDNKFSRFWKALVDGKAEWKSSSKSWLLPKEFSWLGDSGNVINLYNRECYDEICQYIKEAPTNKELLILIMGTPGIGKTMFLGRILVDIVAKSKVAKAEGNCYEPLINYYAGSEEKDQYRLLWNGSVVRADANSVDIELSDSVDIKIPRARVLSLEVASDKKAHFTTFDKKITQSEGSLRQWMPVCQFEELAAMNPQVPTDQMEILYDIFGGSARNIFLARKTVTKVDLFPCVEDTMLLFFGKEIKTKYSDLWMRISKHLSHHLFRNAEDESSATLALQSTLRHRNSGTSFWASKFMEVLSGEILQQEETSMKTVIKNLLGASCLGCIFESSSHRALTTTTRRFKLISLHPKGARRALKHSAYIDIPNTVTRIRSIEDISGLNAQEYGLPVSLNFPLIDAVVQPATLLQMTVSPENHSSRSIDRLPSIRAQLHDEVFEHHRMVFVVPESNLASFKYQTQLDGIAQYVMCPNPVVEIPSNKSTKRPSQTIEKKSKKTKR